MTARGGDRLASEPEAGSGLPLMLLHGFMGDRRDWSHLHGRWGGHPVVAVDLPGHGRSLGLDPSCYSLRGAAAACLRTADELGWERFAVIGYSMGGRVAYHLALDRPDRTSALVAVSAHPGLVDTNQRASRLRMDEDRAVRLEADPTGFQEAWYRQPLFETLAADSALMIGILRRRSESVPSELARALVGLSTGTQDPLGERLQSLGVPSLLVTGRADAAYEPLLRALAASSRRLRHVSIVGAGHAVHLEQPDAFVRTVVSFIEEHSRHVLH